MSNQDGADPPIAPLFLQTVIIERQKELGRQSSDRCSVEALARRHGRRQIRDAGGVILRARTRKARPTGTVKWSNAEKGYGFIQQDGGPPDIFVHVSAVERAGMDALREGQKVTYEEQRDPERGKSSAENLRPA